VPPARKAARAPQQATRRADALKKKNTKVQLKEGVVTSNTFGLRVKPEP